MFKEYKNKIKEAVGEKRMEMIISKSLYIICIGSNDIANTYAQTPYRRVKYDIPSYTDLLASYASNFLQVCSVIQTKTYHLCTCLYILKLSNVAFNSQSFKKNVYTKSHQT